jgi:probable HAF family extracellular repeat protein
MTLGLLTIVALFGTLSATRYSTTAESAGTITDLGTLGGDYSDAFGINNDAMTVYVVGQSRTAGGAVHAFFWTIPGPTVDLGGLDGCDSHASDINNHGEIAGGSADALGHRWAVVWTNGGGTWAMEKLGTLTGACCADARGINNGNAGDPSTAAVVGNSEGRAVMWTKSATGWSVRDLGTLPGDTSGSANDVNDRGDVVGLSYNSVTGITTPVLWSTVVGMLPLPRMSGETYALAINNDSDVAGLSTDAFGNRHAVRWRSTTNWTIEDLGTLGGCCSEAYGINGFGDVVCVSSMSQRRSGLQHAFLATPLRMADLGALKRTSVARDVNDFGVVVGASGGGVSNFMRCS